jgi:hypothetical protein
MLVLVTMTALPDAEDGSDRRPLGSVRRPPNADERHLMLDLLLVKSPVVP